VEQEIEYEMYTRALVSVLPRPQHGEDGIGEDGIVTPASVRLMPRELNSNNTSSFFRILELKTIWANNCTSFSPRKYDDSTEFALAVWF